MNTRKWKKFRLSKKKYPTYISMNGVTGTLIIGKETARRALREMLHRNVDHMKCVSSQGEWIFMEPLKK